MGSLDSLPVHWRGRSDDQLAVVEADDIALGCTVVEASTASAADHDRRFGPDLRDALPVGGAKQTLDRRGALSFAFQHQAWKGIGGIEGFDLGYEAAHFDILALVLLVCWWRENHEIASMQHAVGAVHAADRAGP